MAYFLKGLPQITAWLLACLTEPECTYQGRGHRVALAKVWAFNCSSAPVRTARWGSRKHISLGSDVFPSVLTEHPWMTRIWVGNCKKYMKAATGFPYQYNGNWCWSDTTHPSPSSQSQRWPRAGQNLLFPGLWTRQGCVSLDLFVGSSLPPKGAYTTLHF